MLSGIFQVPVGIPVALSLWMMDYNSQWPTSVIPVVQRMKIVTQYYWLNAMKGFFHGVYQVVSGLKLLSKKKPDLNICCPEYWVPQNT